MTKTEKEHAATLLVEQHPELIDYYIKYKEENGEEATSISKQVVKKVKLLFNLQLKELVELLCCNTDFYVIPTNSYDGAYQRVVF